MKLTNRLCIILGLLWSVSAQAQVQYSPPVTVGHVPYWAAPGVIQDAGTADDSPITSLGVTGQICTNSARASTGSWNSLCLQANTGSPSTVSVQNYGTASAQGLNFIINGTIVSIPTGAQTFILGNGPFTIGDVPCFQATSGTIQDCGLALSSGTVTSGVWQGTAIGVGFGGTGATSASGARTNLGLGTMATQNAGTVAITGGSITGLPTPVNPSDAAIKSYVDATATGLIVQPQSTLATAAVLPNSPTYSNGSSGVGATLTAGSNTTLTVDGTSAPLNTVVLVKNQAAPAQNGIYTVTTAGDGSHAWVLTRATYFDQNTEMLGGSYTFVTGGSTNANSSWVLQTTVATVGTSAATFNQFSSSSNAVLSLGGLTGVVTLGNGLTTSGNSIVNNITAGAGIGITGTTQYTIAALNPPTPPGGRLTLVSGQPEMNVDTTSQNLYYAPDTGKTGPIYDGTNWNPQSFVSSTTDQVGLTLALGGSSSWPAATIFDVFLINNSGSIILGTRAWDSSMLPTYTQVSGSGKTTITTGTSGSTWTNASNAFNGTVLQSSATAAATNAGNSTINNCLGQDLGGGNAVPLTKVVITSPTDTTYRGDNPTTVVMSTYGSNDNTNWQRLDANRNVLSTAAVESTSYTYYINSLDATPYRYFRVCTTGNGVNANRFGQIQFYTTTAPSTRRLTRFNGILVNDAPITAQISSASTLSVPQYQATYLGSFQTDASTAGQITADFGYGINRALNLWNYYNRKKVTLVAGIPTLNSALPASATFNYNVTWPQWQDWQGVQSSTSFSVQTLVGYLGDGVTAKFTRQWYINASPNSPVAYEFGIGIDTTISFSGSEGNQTADDVAAVVNQGLAGIAVVSTPPFFGTHTFYGIEKLTYQPIGTVQAFENIQNTALYVTTWY